MEPKKIKVTFPYEQQAPQKVPLHVNSSFEDSNIPRSIIKTKKVLPQDPKREESKEKKLLPKEDDLV